MALQPKRMVGRRIASEPFPKKYLGESSITIEDLAEGLRDAAQAFVDMAGKFQLAAQHFARIAEIAGAEDDE